MKAVCTVSADRASRTPRDSSDSIRTNLGRHGAWVLVCGAVAPAPDLIVADGPTTDLDVTVQAEVLELPGCATNAASP